MVSNSQNHDNYLKELKLEREVELELNKFIINLVIFCMSSNKCSNSAHALGILLIIYPKYPIGRYKANKIQIWQICDRIHRMG